jgi:subtilisin family serine protease
MPPSPAPGFSPAHYRAPGVIDYVVCELAYDSRVAVPPGAEGFAAPEAAAPTRDALNQVLERFDIKRVAPQFGEALRKKDFTRRIAEPLAAPGVSAPDASYALAGFVQIVPESPRQAAKLAEQLARTPGVWKAYLAPRPEPAGKAAARRTAGRKPGAKPRAAPKAAPAPAPTGPAGGSRNFEPAQGYLGDAPDGIGAAGAWGRPGAAGKGVTVCDIEGGWQLDHEDLPRGIGLIGGTMIDDLGWRNHGTAVLGEMVSVRGNVGCVGICHEAKAVVHSAVIGGVFNAAGAIVAAADALKPGDVILIELHAPGGPDGKYVAMQHWPDVFAAIRAATARGIVVVEAAGNGDEDFDRPEYAGTPTQPANGLQRDSGAIVVGAGVPPANYFDAHDFFGQFPPYSRIGAPRSRIWFSNHGRIVDLQGWGWHVTTLGYGDAQGGADEKRWYTHRFSGTSSASPIVTGAVACLQGFAKARVGRPLTPSEVRDILKATGTPQADDAPRAPVSQNIGPQPNLAAALAAAENRFGGA